MPAIVWATLRRCCSGRRRAGTDDTGIADFSISGGGWRARG